MSVSGEEVDKRTDLFAFGCVLYELLTQKVPYETLGGAAGASEHKRHSFAKKLVDSHELSIYPDDLPVTLWKSIDKLLRRSLQFEPSQRFETPSSWLDSIDSIFDGIKRLGRMGLWERTALNLVDLPMQCAGRLHRLISRNRR